MSGSIAAVVFDLDGVLVDSESVWDCARREVVAGNGGRWQADATRTMMGMSSPEWSRYLHDKLGVPLEPEQISELVVAALLDQYQRRLAFFIGEPADFLRHTSVDCEHCGWMEMAAARAIAARHISEPRRLVCARACAFECGRCRPRQRRALCGAWLQQFLILGRKRTISPPAVRHEIANFFG